MNTLRENLFRKLFPEFSVDELQNHLDNLKRPEDTLEFEFQIYLENVRGALYSKKYKLYTLWDEELNILGDDNYQQQRYMRRCEDAVEDSSEENKKGFYQAWAELEDEEQGIQFEVSRRKFLDERKESNRN